MQRPGNRCCFPCQGGACYGQLPFSFDRVLERCRRAEVVRLLLAQGAYPLLTDNAQHKTCLHYAAQVGWASCCAVLLSDTTFFRGSGHLLRNTEIRQRDGTTRKYSLACQAFEWCSGLGFVIVLESAQSPTTTAVRRIPEEASPLFSQPAVWRSASVDHWRPRRFIDLEAAMGYTALHIAASHGHLETTKVLLKFGASLTCECRSGLRTPATAVHRPPLVTRAHVTPLHIAAARRNVPMCRAMLQAHVSVVRCTLGLHPHAPREAHRAAKRALHAGPIRGFLRIGGGRRPAGVRHPHHQGPLRAAAGGHCRGAQLPTPCSHAEPRAATQPGDCRAGTPGQPP